MKQTLEEAAIEELIHSYSNKYNGNGAFEYGQEAMLNMFRKGAEWKAKQSPWISIDEQFPEDKQLVLCSSPIYGKVVLCWDELSQSWSYPESDEIYCDWDKVDCWMLIPEV